MIEVYVTDDEDLFVLSEDLPQMGIDATESMTVLHTLKYASETRSSREVVSGGRAMTMGRRRVIQPASMG